MLNFPMRLGEPVAPAAFASIRRRLALEAGKWDAQLGDVSVLAPFPLLLQAETWQELSRLAEALTAETLALEQALAMRPKLWRALGLLSTWGASSGQITAQGRIFRFDFHFTTEGWRLSEVNSDVPGGLAEATEFPALVAGHFPGTRPCGAPGERWVRCIEQAAGGGIVGLMSAPGYLEDQQVMAYLAQRLRGVHVQPRQIAWRAGQAWLGKQPLGALVRFYQGEWLLRERGGPVFLQASGTPVLNPGTALLSESKRLPLLWERFGVPVPVWRSLLPECREPAEVSWQTDEGWLLKKAYSNTGDDVHCCGWDSAAEWRRAVQRRPQEWVAQRRFATLPLAGLRPCLGIYTVDGLAAGIYGRISAQPVTGYDAQDIAVLTETANAATYE